MNFLFGPTNEINSIHDAIKKNVQKCSVSDDIIYCPCENGKYSKFPTITIYIQNNAFVINPENYLSYYSGYCVALVLGIPSSFWVLGQPFFRAYYTVHDMDNEEIYLWKAKQDNPVKLNDDESNYFIQSSILIPAGLLITGIVYAYRRRQIASYNYQVL